MGRMGAACGRDAPGVMIPVVLFAVTAESEGGLNVPVLPVEEREEDAAERGGTRAEGAVWA